MSRLSPVFRLLARWPGRLHSANVTFHIIGDSPGAAPAKTYSQLLTCLADRRGGKAIRLSFDDACKGVANWSTAASDAGVSTTIFVAPDIVGTAQGHQLIADWTEIEYAASLPNVSVQSHALTHRNLTRLSLNEVANELKDSRSILEDRLGVEISEIAYPRGKSNYAIRGLCRTYGYTRGWSTNPGHLCARRVGTLDDLNMPRISWHAGEPFDVLIGQLTGASCGLHQIRPRR